MDVSSELEQFGFMAASDDMTLLVQGGADGIKFTAHIIAIQPKAVVLNREEAIKLVESLNGWLEWKQKVVNKKQ